MPQATNPEREAIFARAKLETERLRAIANEWTEKYRKIRREKYGDPPSSDDDDDHNDNDNKNKNTRKDGKDGPARGPGDYGKEKKSSYVIQTNIEPLRNLPGIMGPVDEGLLSGGSSSKKGMKPGMIGLAKTLKMGPQKGRVDARGGKGDARYGKGTGKRVLEEEEESEEEVGRTGAFKARKKESVGNSSSIKDRVKLVEDNAQAATASSEEPQVNAEEEEDWDGISEGGGDDSPNTPKDGGAKAASGTGSKKKKRKKKKKKNKKDTG